jgi:hypothetical protein
MRYMKPLIGIFILVLSASIALAAGNWPWNTGRPAQQGQNLKAISSNAAQSRCDTVGIPPVQKQYSTIGYLGVYATAYNPVTGAPVVVKWLEDGKPVWVGSTYEGVNDQGKAYSHVTAVPFNNNTTAFCIRRQ